MPEGDFGLPFEGHRKSFPVGNEENKQTSDQAKRKRRPTHCEEKNSLIEWAGPSNFLMEGRNLEWTWPFQLVTFFIFSTVTKSEKHLINSWTLPSLKRFLFSLIISRSFSVDGARKFNQVLWFFGASSVSRICFQFLPKTTRCHGSVSREP